MFYEVWWAYLYEVWYDVWWTHLYEYLNYSTHYAHSLQLPHPCLQIKTTMTNDGANSALTVIPSRFSSNYVVCDNEAHTIVLTVLFGGLSLAVDGDQPQFTEYPSLFQLPTATELPVYIGGIKGTFPSPKHKSLANMDLEQLGLHLQHISSWSNNYLERQWIQTLILRISRGEWPCIF